MIDQTHSKGGRPSKYSEDLPEKLLAFFKEFLDNPTTTTITKKLVKFYPNGQTKEEQTEYKEVSKEIPTLIAFADSIEWTDPNGNKKVGVSASTVRAWATERIGETPEKGEVDKRPFKYPEFSAAYKRAVDFQTRFILKVGMAGFAQPSMVIFAAKNMIGWRDAIDQRFVDKEDKDRPMPSYVLLPPRKIEQEVEDEFNKQNDDTTN